MNEVDRKLAGAGTRLQGLECGAGVAVPERDITRPRYRNRVGQRLARTSTSSLSHDEQEELVEFMEEAQWPYGSGGNGRREEKASLEKLAGEITNEILNDGMMVSVAS